MKMKDFMELSNPTLAEDMEVFDKLDDYICNYENMGALYGYDSIEAREVLFRGVRNAFYLGQDFEAEKARQLFNARRSNKK